MPTAHVEEYKSLFREWSVYISFTLPAGGDFTALSPEPSEIVFSPAESGQSRNVTISIINDVIHEETEQFTVQLSLPSGSTGVVLGQNLATVQILDEDRECCVHSIMHICVYVFAPPFQE